MKYLLLSEQKKINTIIEDLTKDLYQINIQELNSLVFDIIKNNKDANTEDILNNILNNLTDKMIPLLKNHMTKGIQFGIKNNYY